MKLSVLLSNFTIFLLQVKVEAAEEGIERCSVKLEILLHNGVCTNPPTNKQNKHCNKSAICDKEFNVIHMRKRPYSTLIFKDVLQTCCGECVKVRTIATIRKLDQIVSPLAEGAHFIFPVFARREVERLYGMRFLPLFKAPNMYYVTHKRKDFIQVFQT